MFKKNSVRVKRCMAMLLVVAMIIGMMPMSILAVGYDFEEDHKDLEIRFWEDEKPDLGFYIDATAKYVIEMTPEPEMGSVGGEWAVMDLLRGMYTGYDYVNYIQEDYFEDYLGRIEDYVVENEGNLHRAKSTEWSRLMLTFSSLGYDIKSVASNHPDETDGGYDFIKRLSDSHKFSNRQGINGPIWEIIAMNTGGYEFYKQEGNADVNTFGKMINEILNKEIYKGEDNAGGWALYGKNPDPDITGMALQALAPYYLDKSLYEKFKDENSPSYEEFASAVERAIFILADVQQENGGYFAWGTVNAESTVQVIVALTALGIDPLSKNVELKNIGKSCSFIKSGGDRDGIQTNNMIDALLTFWTPGSGETSPEVGGFRHVTEGYDGGGGSGTKVNGMATEQSLYGLIAYDRFLKKGSGIKSLYDMTDMMGGEYKSLMSEGKLDSKAHTLKLQLDGKAITERKSPYAAIELPMGENLIDKVFKNWNTKSDGTGTMYKAGEYLSMPNKDIVLYAQYKGYDEFEGLKEIYPVNDLVVSKGTAEDKVIDLLPKTTKIKDFNNEEYVVDLSWIIDKYNKDTIGNYNAIGNFTLPEGVKNEDSKLSLEVKATVKVYKEIDESEVKIDKASATIVKYTGTDKEIVIPNKIDNIIIRKVGEGAFANAEISKIFIPNTVTIIGKNAFKDNRLEEVNIPTGITSIEHGAFQNNKLNKVKLPNGLHEIGKDVFRDNQLTEVNIPDSLKTIGDAAFMNNLLVKVEIPDQIRSIESNVFNNNKIETLSLPNELQDIKTGAFAKNKLTSLDIPESVVSIGNNGFGENALKTLKISNKLKTIGANAFRDNQLTEVFIPKNVRRIGATAFELNNIIDGMAKIDNHKSKVEIEGNTFKSNGENKTTHIKPIFLKDVKDSLNITEVELLKAGKSISKGKIDESNLKNKQIVIELANDFPKEEIDEIGLGSYTLVIKGTNGSDIRQADGASGDWSGGKTNTVSVNSPTKFTIEKYGVKNEYTLTIKGNLKPEEPKPEEPKPEEPKPEEPKPEEPKPEEPKPEEPKPEEPKPEEPKPEEPKPEEPKPEEPKPGEEVQRVSGSTRVETAISTSKLAYKDGAETVLLAGFTGEVDALTGTLLASSSKAPLLLTKKDRLSDGIEEELSRLNAKKIIILGGEEVVSDKVKSQLGTKYNIKRVSGINRAETAAKVAEEVAGKNTDHIFLALGYNNQLADALAIGPVSAMKSSPVLLTQSNKLPKETKQVIKDLEVKEITIIGGYEAVNKKVEEELVGIKINRIQGKRREETALKIAQKYFDTSTSAIVASGYNYADALVGGYFGALTNSPILLTKSETLPIETKGYLKEHSNQTYVLGGEKVISNSVIKEIQSAK